MLDHLYRHLMRARRGWYARHPEAVRRLAHPVIAVGNLSVGGTGKTPLVAAIAERLVALGERPAILSRGYGRRRPARGPLVVSDGVRIRAGAAEAGDEPSLLAQLVPGAIVVVGANRYASGQLAEATLGCTMHVLDDGFQHVRLARDVDVLVTTPGEIMAGRVLPFGRLREGAEAAGLADVLVVVGASAQEAAAEARQWGVAASCGATRVSGRAVPDAEHADLDPARLCETGAPVVAVAGIAHPDRFFDGLRAGGWTVAATLPYADHHWFTAADVTRIAATVRDTGARLVLATGKDVVKLDRLRPLPFPLATVPLTLTVDPETAIDGWIAQARARHGVSRGGAR